MIRGAEKRMIVVRTRESRVFEEAYFVVRHDATGNNTSELDMLREANRIIERNTVVPAAPPRRASKERLYAAARAVALFLAGTLCGAGCVGLCLLLG